MKWYPLAHSAAVTMSCFSAELQALQLLFPNSASGIARALPSFLLYIFKFPDSRCRPLVSLSDNLNPFQRCREGKHKLCTYGAGMAKCTTVGGLAPRHTQRPPTYRDAFFPCQCQKVTEKLTQYSYSSSWRGKHLIGNTAMDIVKFRPRWLHTWRYAHHSLSCPTMTSGCLGYSETCIKRTLSGNAVIIIGRLQSRRLRASSSHNDPVPIQTACPGQSCCLCLPKGVECI